MTKKIEKWEDYMKLPESAKAAIGEYACIEQNAEGNYMRVRTFGVAACVMVGSSVMYREFFGQEIGEALGSLLASFIYLGIPLLGIGIAGAYAFIWTLSLLEQRRMKDKIQKQHGIDVSGMKLMLLQMEYERRV